MMITCQYCGKQLDTTTEFSSIHACVSPKDEGLYKTEGVFDGVYYDKKGHLKTTNTQSRESGPVIGFVNE